jgi:hypothetical protein
VDETGHQMAVFGRIGSRPFNLEEMRQLYMRDDGTPWYVSNDVDDWSTTTEKSAPRNKADSGKESDGMGSSSATGMRKR